MNSRDIAILLRSIAETPGKNDKVLAIAAHHNEPDLHMVLTKAYDPFITYGIRKVPARTIGTPDGLQFTNRVWDILHDLSTRKLSGNSALNVVESALNALDDLSAELLTNIIRKDLRAGFSEETINKAIKGLIPVVPYQRCCLPKDAKLVEWPWKDGVYSQLKADGLFCNVTFRNYGNSEVQLSSRQGQILPMEQFAALEDDIRVHLEADYQYHGEIVVWQDGNPLERALSNGVMNRVSAGGAFEPGEQPRLFLWDKVPLSSTVPKGRCETPYSLRYESLLSDVQHGTMNLGMIETKRVRSLDEAYGHYREQLAKGLEGTILKHPDAIWKDGTSKQQVKLKLEADCDLKIVGFNPGEGKNAATFGSIVARSACEQLEVSVSGMADKVRAEIHARREQVLGSVLTVKANSIMLPSESNPLHSLYLPRFVEIRTDKTQADDLPRIRAQFEAAINA